jgi:hypothetical protein
MLAATVCGCAMCDNVGDEQYGARGGRRARLDMVHGRVASLFDPASAIEPTTLPGVVPPPDPEVLPPTPEPEPEAEEGSGLPDELEQFLPDVEELPEP